MLLWLLAVAVPQAQPGDPLPPSAPPPPPILRSVSPLSLQPDSASAPSAPREDDARAEVRGQVPADATRQDAGQHDSWARERQPTPRGVQR